VATRPGSVDQQRREALDPSVDGHVVNVNSSFGHEFFDVSIGEAVTQVPAHRQQDHLWREPIASERNGLIFIATIYPHTIAA
jgi:hypothetical protein